MIMLNLGAKSIDKDKDFLQVQEPSLAKMLKYIALQAINRYNQ